MHYEAAGRRRRRRHSAEFKAEAVAACRKPGVSIAAAALERSINANLLRRWVLEAERGEGIESLTAPDRPRKAAFIALPSPPKAVVEPIQIEVRRGPTTVIVQWPVTALPECSLWLRELLK